MSNVLQNQSNKILITQSMLENPEYDQGFEKDNTMTPTQSTGTKPLAMFVFHQSDIDSATYYLAKSLENPLSANAIKCAFVQESCLEKFSQKLKSKLKPYTKKQLENEKLKEAIEKSNEIITRLNAKTIPLESPFSHHSLVVFDFAQEHLTEDGKPLPVVTIQTFRTVKEAIALLSKESIYTGATIWCENQAMAFEVIAETPLRDYYLNCCNISWAPIQQYIVKAHPFALIEKSYHYETLGMSGSQKNIVFPFGTSFAN